MRVSIVLRFMKLFISPINLCFIAYNIEMSLEDLMYENVRVENYCLCKIMYSSVKSWTASLSQGMSLR